jgi:D-alanine transaminase
MLVYLNGDYVPRERALIPVDDRGFLFGDGIYEVTRAVGGQLFEPERHARRLRRGVDGLRIALPAGAEDELVRVSERLLAENEMHDGEATVYVQVTRGAVAPRTHQFPPAGTPPTIYVGTTRFTAPDAVRERGVAVTTFPDIRWGRCDLKTVNLLPNVLAKQAAVDAGAFEGVFVRDGVVTEGAQTTIFAVVDGTLRTHPLSERILPSVTREVVLELAAELRIAAREEAFTLEELRGAASEAFLASTTSDVMPVVSVDGAAIGEGRPGAVGRALGDALARRLGRVGAGAR